MSKVILISQTANGFVATVAKSSQDAYSTRIDDMHCFQELGDVGRDRYRTDQSLLDWVHEQLNPPPAPQA